MLDDLDLSDVLPFERGLLDYVDHNTDILKVIRETGDFTDETEKKLDDAIEAFRKTYVRHDGTPLVNMKTAAAEPTEVEQEVISARRTSDRTDPADGGDSRNSRRRGREGKPGRKAE